MRLGINREAPNFTADTTQGRINFHEWIGDEWAILFSHPRDFAPVSTTELGYVAALRSEFERRHCKIIALSADPLDSHREWSKDIEETQGHSVTYPIISDSELKVARLYEMLPEVPDIPGHLPSATDIAPARWLFVIGPDKQIKAILIYPASSGRNFDEVLRLLDSCQLTAKYKIATPVNWKQGQDVIIVPTVSDEEAKRIYPAGWKAPKPYLRIVPMAGGPDTHGDDDPRPKR